MKKLRILGLLAILVFAVTIFTGCGSKPATDSKPADSKPAESKPADGKEPIKVGANFELTGGIATFGNSAVNAIQLAFDEINAAGGVDGRQLELVKADNKSEAAESTNSITKLITQDKVVAVLGPISSSNSLAAAPVAQAKKIPMITPTATNPKVTVGDDNKVKEFVFRTCFIDPFQGKVAAEFAAKTLKAKTAAIYIDSSSDYSKGLAEVFKKTFTDAGGKIVSEEAFLAKDTDFKATLTKIKNANPDVIYVPGYYEEVGKIIRQGRELGIKQAFLGGDGFDSPKLAEIAGKAALNNAFFTNHYTAKDSAPIVQNFVKQYKDKYGSEPDALAALGYDAAKMLVDGIKRAGSTDAAALAKALAETKNLELVTGNITLDAQHNPVKSAVIIELKDGEQVFKERVNP